MPIRQSILALYGAIAEGFDQLNDPQRSVSTEEADAIRAAAKILVSGVGITGSVGERGWYRELLGYFDQHLVEGAEPLTSLTVTDVLNELNQSTAPIAPSWEARAIEAALTLHTMAQYGIGPDVPANLLERVLTRAPMQPERTLGDDAKDLADALRNALTERLFGAPGGAIAAIRQVLFAAGVTSAVAPGLYARLRKVKSEYCSVVSSDCEWPEISYAALLGAVNPQNWHLFYDEFFCDMIYDQLDPQGWAKIREVVSGDCARYRLRTALRFWSAGGDANGFFINYDVDPKPANANAHPPPTDPLVIVDNGYIWVTPLPAGAGVRVRTSKELLISGMSATAMANMAATLGWATNASDMFHEAAKGALGDVAFAPSVPNPAQMPPVDTSTTWPVKVPAIPDDLRDEMARDTATVAKRGLDLANAWSTDFASKWEKGIDAPDTYELIGALADDIKNFADFAFDTSTENFRPRSPTNTGQ
jgi:hypothetical protein